jgi:hypothetical protein
LMLKNRQKIPLNTDKIKQTCKRAGLRLNHELPFNHLTTFYYY